MTVVDTHISTSGKRIHIHLKDENGKQSIGEIAPLPNYSQETLEEAYDQLKKVAPLLPKSPKLSELNLYPSVYFGIESALQDLQNPIPIDHVQSYAFFWGPYEEVLKRADAAYAEGYREAKLKLDHFTEKEGHELIARLNEKFRLRLDLNRKWDLKKSLNFFSRYTPTTFAYIEEPLSNPEELKHFPLPFALDETLREKRSLDPFYSLPQFTTVILKPTLSYPLPFFPGKKRVLTSSFEGPIGIAQIKKLIARLQLTDTLHGLDTLRYTDPIAKN